MALSVTGRLGCSSPVSQNGARPPLLDACVLTCFFTIMTLPPKLLDNPFTGIVPFFWTALVEAPRFRMARGLQGKKTMPVNPWSTLLPGDRTDNNHNNGYVNESGEVLNQQDRIEHVKRNFPRISTRVNRRQAAHRRHGVNRARSVSQALSNKG